LALGDLKDPVALPVLMDSLKDEDWFARGEAALALGKIGDANAAEALFAMLADPDQYVRQCVCKALQELATQNNKPAYLKALTNPDKSTHTMAAVALANAGSPEGVRILIERLADSQTADLPEIIRALTKLKHPDGLPAIRRLVEHSNATIRALGILSLGEYQDKESEKVLEKMAKNPDQPASVKTACIIAVSRIRSSGQ
jgi:HEAT repeat protein